MRKSWPKNIIFELRVPRMVASVWDKQLHPVYFDNFYSFSDQFDVLE